MSRRRKPRSVIWVVWTLVVHALVYSLIWSVALSCLFGSMLHGRAAIALLPLLGLVVWASTDSALVHVEQGGYIVRPQHCFAPCVATFSSVLASLLMLPFVEDRNRLAQLSLEEAVMLAGIWLTASTVFTWRTHRYFRRINTVQPRGFEIAPTVRSEPLEDQPPLE